MGIVRVVASLLCVVPLTVAADVPPPPPEIPGYQYIRSLDGCGVLADTSAGPAIEDASRELFEKKYWLGECRHGLAEGFGYWIDPTPDTFFALMQSVQMLGQQHRKRASIEPSAGITSISSSASVQYALHSEDLKTFDMAIVPMVWNIDDPYIPSMVPTTVRRWTTSSSA